MPDAFLVFIGIVVFAQMFDVGLRARPGGAAALGRDPWLLLQSLAAVLVAVPLAVFVLVALIPLPQEVALGLVILAAAPGAPLTTRRAEAAGADRDYVAALQAVLATLAAVHMPLVLAAFDEVSTLSIPPIAPEKIAGQVAIVTFLPLALGWLFARAAPEVLRRRAGLLSQFSRLLFFALLLVVVLALAFVPDLREKLMIGWAGAGAVVLLAALALAAGHALGGPRGDRRAGLAVATVARNLGLALYVAERTPQMDAAIPTILTYGLLAMLLAMPYARWIKGRLHAAEATSPDRTG